MKRLLPAIICTLAAVGVPGFAQAADNFPSKAVRIIVPFAPGGGGDFIVRAWSDRLAEILKQPVIVDNRGGGNTVIGTDALARSAPDGYTLVIVSPAFATNPTLHKSLPYRTPEDFAPVARIITYAMGLGARSTLEANNIPELLELSRKQPGTVFNIATSGEGSASHLASELLRAATKLPLVNVPYKGAGPALLDVASGHVDLGFSGMSQIKPHLDTGRAKLLATSGLRRLQSAPDTPTIAEQGLPGFEAVVWWGLLAPAGTPAPIVDKLNQALKQALSDPEVTKKLSVIDGEVAVSTPAEFLNFIQDEIKLWGKLLSKPE